MSASCLRLLGFVVASSWLVADCSSPYAAEGYVAFGEYYFDRGESSDSLKFYDRAAQYPASRLQTYVQYMRAWTLYRIGDARAASTFSGCMQSTPPAGGEEQQPFTTWVTTACRSDFARLWPTAGPGQ